METIYTQFKNYTVLKGMHYCINFFPKIKLKRHVKNDDLHTDDYYWLSSVKRVWFNENSKYEVDEPGAVNKLFGFCYGLFNIHKYSDRIGWRYNKAQDVFDVYLYSYNEGVLHKQIIDKLLCNEFVDYYLYVTFSPDMKQRYVQIWRQGMQECASILHDNEHLKFNLISTLGLYFGGKKRAPKTVKVGISKIQDII